jgi:hypothetical protein
VTDLAFRALDFRGVHVTRVSVELLDNGGLQAASGASGEDEGGTAAAGEA